TSTVAAFRYFLGQRGRDLLEAFAIAAADVGAIEDVLDDRVARRHAHLQTAAGATVRAAELEVQVKFVDKRKEAEVESIRAGGRSAANVFDAWFLRHRHRRHLSAAEVAEEHRYLLRRLMTRALMALAAVSLIVTVACLVLGATLLSLGALLAGLG